MKHLGRGVQIWQRSRWWQYSIYRLYITLSTVVKVVDWENKVKYATRWQRCKTESNQKCWLKTRNTWYSYKCRATAETAATGQCSRCSTTSTPCPWGKRKRKLDSVEEGLAGLYHHPKCKSQAKRDTNRTNIPCGSGHGRRGAPT